MGALASVLSLAGPAPVITAQQSQGLELGDVVRATLESNTGIRLAVQQAEAARGSLIRSGAAFDLRVVSDASTSRVHLADPLSGSPSIRKQLRYSLGLERLFRNGIALEHSLALTRTGYATQSVTGNSAQVGLTATLPLLRDRAGALSSAPERAALHDYESSRLQLYHVTAQRVLGAVVAYWDYLSAQRRLEALHASEERAQRTVDQTRVLVQAEERTPADLTQVLGNLASKKVTRLSSEQALFEARQQLGLAIGLPAEDIARLPPAATSFPSAAADTPPVVPASWVAAALARRADLAAAEQDLRSAEALLASSRNALKPRLDFSVRTDYTSSGLGTALDDLLGPLYRKRPEPNVAFELSFELPTANSAARGRLLENASATEQQRIAQADLRRLIASDVTVACEALALAAAAAAESENAVRLLDATVLAEQRKFQLGVSTLFDVIQAQDGLTSALLSQVQSQRGYAVAIATLRFQAGVLLSGDRDLPGVELRSLLSPPESLQPAGQGE